MTERKTIDEVAKSIESLTRNEFLAKHGGPFLVQITSGGEALSPEAQQTLVGSKARRLSLDYLKTKIETQAFLRVNFSIVEGYCSEIKNHAKNEGRSFIGVGRDPSCDILLPDETIAPRHGFFKIGTDAVTFTHAAAGTTLVNGTALKSRKAKVMNNHDVLEFADNAAYVYLAPNGAYDFLMACAVANSIPETQIYN